MAMAREVGWVPSANPTNQFDIDFVDFRPNTNGTPSSLPVLPKDETPATEISGASSAPIATSGTIPAFVSGNNIVIAIDSTIAPSGSQLTFSAAPDNQAQQTLGTTILGDNPLVVTLGGFSTNGGTLTITAGTFVGPSNIFHTYIPGTRPP